MAVVLDLFCGVGGAARGFQRLGYDVVGVDLEPQPKYPGRFHQADLRDGLPDVVDDVEPALVWASPPCTWRTRMTTRRSGENLIPLARSLVESIGVDYIIENVPDAADELRNPVPLVGDAFGLEVRKKRLFETSFAAYGAPGNFSLNRGYDFSIGDREHPVEDYREAHGFDRDCSLTAKELREAIPPAYVAHLVEQAERVALTHG